MAKTKAPKKPSIAALSLVEEPLSTASIDRDLCKTCGRGASIGAIASYVPKDYTGRLLFVYGTPATPEERKVINGLAYEAGYAPADVAHTSAVRCGAGVPDMKQIRCCRPYVLRVVNKLNPGLIIALGPSATRSLTNLGSKTNITRLRGRPLVMPGMEGKLAYASYEPSAVLASVPYRVRVLEDLRRAGEARLEYPFEAIPVGNVLSVDTEYAPDKTLLTVGVADLEASASAEPSDEAAFREVTEAIKTSPGGTVLVGHSLTGDLDYLVQLGVARESWVSGEKTQDSLLLARMQDENRGKGGYGLEILLTSSRNVEPWKYKTEAYDKADATTWPPDLRAERCRLDAWASAVVAEDAYCAVASEGQPIELTHRIAASLHRVELAGVYIDMPTILSMESELQQSRDYFKHKLTTKAHTLGMASFNPTNDTDIRDLLYKKLKLPVLKTTKKGGLAAVDKTTLKQHLDVPVVQDLLEFNKVDKALSTNIVGVLPRIVPVTDTRGWLPININPLGARTGRRSSERPNMQNWAANLRRMVVSRYPGGSILEFDYKSLEVFLLAFVAGDDKLYDYFANRGGYIAVAKDMWKTDVKKGSNEYRATKSVVLGTNYNMQTALMAENLWLMGVKFSSDYETHEQETDRLRNAYLDMFPGLRPYMARQKQLVLKEQRVTTLTGRVRHLPNQGKRSPGVGRLINQGINFPIQGLAADVTGSGLVDCERVLCDLGGMSLLQYHYFVLSKGWTAEHAPLAINEVHDNLVFDLPYGPESQKAKDVAAALKDAMESVRTLRELVPGFTLPLRVDMKLGPHWGMED